MCATQHAVCYVSTSCVEDTKGTALQGNALPSSALPPPHPAGARGHVASKPGME